jgi:uncharacterized protein (DUF1697 family)
MPWVVFLRAVNVGGHQKLQPSLLAKKLAKFDVANVGAAGTFVVRKAVGQAALRTEILRTLPFKPEMMICPASDVIALVATKPFGDALPTKDVRQLITIMLKAPRSMPRLPLDKPAGKDWQVRILSIRGQFAASLWRPQKRAMLYPNAFVEKQFGIPATTRSWSAFSTIRKLLQA